MGTDPKFGRFCDECGATFAKAHKVHEGQEYCTTCYARVFKPADCEICGSRVRAHRNAQSPIHCRKCQAAARTCIRCEKPVPRAGILMPNGAVCPSCVPYFKEPEHCAQCHRSTTRLSAMPSMGVHEKICDSCRNRYTHKTCSACGKYRKVVDTGDGRCICERCVKSPAATHPCPTCSVAVPGTGASRCRGCVNRESVLREVTLTQHVFSNQWTREAWLHFADWLLARGPENPKVLAQLRAQQPLFERLDAAFASSNEVREPALLQAVGSGLLRTHLLGMQFLESHFGIVVSNAARAESSDQERINEILNSARHETWFQVLASYHEHLSASALSIRTRRMYLSTAKSYLQAYGPQDLPWRAGDLERYLNANPGARNSLGGFVRFCRQKFNWEVFMPGQGRRLEPLGDAVEAVMKLAGLLAEVDEMGLSNVNRKTVIDILSTALGLSSERMRELTADNLAVSAEGSITLNVGAELVAIPEELAPFALRLKEGPV